MSDYCYVLDDKQGTRLYLTNEGLQTAAGGLVDELERDGFRHAEDRMVGSCVLHIFQRPLLATDIVATAEPECETASLGMNVAG